jgi:flagellar L-ring protein precursor FlgH
MTRKSLIHYFFIVAGLVATLAAGQTVAGQTVAGQQTSLWQRRDPALANQFADVKASRPGDLLVVVINERSDVENRDQRLLQKQNSSSSEASFNYAANGDISNGSGGIGFDQDSAASRDFNGNTQYRSEREFLDRFTVTVVDTTPNGNLLVSGTRHVSLEGDQRTLVLTGIVRAVDVLANNSVPSQRVANLDIRYASDYGAEQKFINQGWLGKKLNRWWPY